MIEILAFAVILLLMINIGIYLLSLDNSIKSITYLMLIFRGLGKLIGFMINLPVIGILSIIITLDKSYSKVRNCLTN